MRLDDPRRALELFEKRRAVAIGNARVDRGRADALVPEVVLDELERDTGIEQMGRDRVSQSIRILLMNLPLCGSATATIPSSASKFT